MKKYKIKEIFGPTLQGEGTHAGRPVLFIRFSGCNKWNGREASKMNSICSYCDTDFVGGDMMTKEEILAKLQSLDIDIRDVVMTGGEPTMQIDEELLDFLDQEHHYALHLETNGSIDIGDLAEFFDHITVSPKQTIEETKLAAADDLKLLHPPIAEGIDVDGFLVYEADNLFIQPVMDDNYDENLKSAIKECYKTGGRLSLQTHKIIGVE